MNNSQLQHIKKVNHYTPIHEQQHPTTNQEESITSNNSQLLHMNNVHNYKPTHEQQSPTIYITVPYIHE